MLALLTSCGRFDLLMNTLYSLQKNQQCKFDLRIYEDSFNNKGQNKIITQFFNDNKEYNDKYYLHLEDDWEFENNYDWIKSSIEIMESDSSIIKVINRSDIVHACEFNNNGIAILNKWIDTWEGNEWYGFGWNVGVTRFDLLKKFMPIDCNEQELSKRVHMAGYKVAVIKNSTCRHIGQDRSTH